jgi:cytochrome c-type biogenesis protein CcmH/NrfF
VQEGETDSQIKAYLISRYGEDILLQPRSKLVWALPVLGVGAAVGGLGLVLRRRRARPGGTASDEDQALVERAMRARS